MSAEPMKTDQLHILVLGTLAFQTVLIPRQVPDDDQIRKAVYDKECAWVGAVLVQNMIKKALADVSVRLHPDYDRIDAMKTCALELTSVFAQLPKRSFKESDRVWRVNENYRVWRDPECPAGYKGYLKEKIEECESPNIVVVYEQDRYFREAFRELAAGRPARAARHESPSALIVASARRVDKTSVEAARRIFGIAPDAVTILLVTANGLRQAGLNIVTYGSFEQVVQQLSEYLCEDSGNALTDVWNCCSHLLILYDETGIVSLRKPDQRTNTNDKGGGSFHYCPNFDNTAPTHKAQYGRVPGRMAIALTAVTQTLCKRHRDGKPLDLESPLLRAMIVYNKLFDEGFQEKTPFKRVTCALSPKLLEELKGALEAKESKDYFLTSSLTFPIDPNKEREWDRLDSVFATSRPDDVAWKIVWKGSKEAFRDESCESQPDGLEVSEWPKAQITRPFMTVGELEVFDKIEIEQFGSLIKLMRKYRDDPSWKTPLSIAVFGPPGTGKSFTVRQVMKVVNPGIKDSSILTFNLAQFNSLELLTEAFHQVQDQALSSEVTPLVIFDEFDSNFETRWGWLKYFLAPMEDGVFRGRTANYKVGRAVFLFAGGTAESFEQFRSNNENESYPEESAILKAAKKAAKLPDFCSRLMAHLNILGINALQPESERQKNRLKVKRAILLRSLLERFAKPIISASGRANVTPEVAKDFLNVDVRYKNGTRSMQAIVKGSCWIDNQFLLASLPSKSLIELHAERWPRHS